MASRNWSSVSQFAHASTRAPHLVNNQWVHAVEGVMPVLNYPPGIGLETDQQ